MKQLGWVAATIGWLLSPTVLEQGFLPWMIVCVALLSLTPSLLWLLWNQWTEAQDRIDQRTAEKHQIGSEISSALTRGIAQMPSEWFDANPATGPTRSTPPDIEGSSSSPPDGLPTISTTGKTG